MNRPEFANTTDRWVFISFFRDGNAARSADPSPVPVEFDSRPAVPRVPPTVAREGDVAILSRIRLIYSCYLSSAIRSPNLSRDSALPCAKDSRIGNRNR